MTLLDLDDKRYAVTGLEIGADRVLAAVYSLRGRELLRIERPADVDAVNPRALLRRAATVLHLARWFQDWTPHELRFRGIGVANTTLARSVLAFLPG